MTESAIKLFLLLPWVYFPRNPVLTSFGMKRAITVYRTGGQDRSLSVAPATAQQVGTMPMDWLPIYWVRFIYDESTGYARTCNEWKDV